MSLPEYTIESQPDYETLGSRIDMILADNFGGKHIAIRAISSADHPVHTLQSLIDVILTTGTDKYDPARKGVAHEEFAPYEADFHADACIVGKNHVGQGADIIQKFYENALIDRGHRVRIDLLLIYDFHQLTRAQKADADMPGVSLHLEKYLFRFTNPHQKQKALLGIIKILR